MLKLTDSGCGQHCPRQITFMGLMAALVGRLVVNLPSTSEGHTYICEYGHTHCVRLYTPKKNRPPGPPGFGYAGDTAPVN